MGLCMAGQTISKGGNRGQGSNWSSNLLIDAEPNGGHPQTLGMGEARAVKLVN